MHIAHVRLISLYSLWTNIASSHGNRISNISNKFWEYFDTSKLYDIAATFDDKRSWYRFGDKLRPSIECRMIHYRLAGVVVTEAWHSCWYRNLTLLHSQKTATNEMWNNLWRGSCAKRVMAVTHRLCKSHFLVERAQACATSYSYPSSAILW